MINQSKSRIRFEQEPLIVQKNTRCQMEHTIFEMLCLWQPVTDESARSKDVGHQVLRPHLNSRLANLVANEEERDDDTQ